MASVARDLTERERARARFRGLLEAAPVAIIAGDVHWRVALANAQAERLFGYPPGELVGRPVGDLFPGYVEAARAGRCPRFAADLAPGEVVALKLAARRRDGAEFFAEVSLTTIETDEGWLALAGVRDGTERELAAIVEFSADAIIGKTLDGVITSWNRGAEEMYGWTSGEMIGRSVSALVPSDRTDELRRLLDAVAEGERVEHLETQRLRKDGSLFDVSLSISPIRDAAGVIVGASTLARDITDTKRAVDALLASEARKTAILNSALDSIICMDHQGRVVEFNPAAERVFGYSRQESVGREMAELIIPPGVRDDHRAGLARYLATGEGPILGTRVEIEAMRADGSVFPAELAITRVDLASPPIFTGYLHDVTERNRIRAELASAEQRRRQSERLESLGQLAGGVAHDFNNLLGVMINYAAFAAEQMPADSPALQDIEEIRRAGERAVELTRQLLTFSRNETVRPEPLDLNASVADMERLLRRTLGEHVTLTTSFAPDLDWVLADPGHMEQILVNLAVNARDAMPNGGELRIETANVELDEDFARGDPETHPGPHVRLVVADNGIGMPREVADRAFDPFFTTKPAGQGTGLGLATVYGIVKGAGGTISLYSESGHGTVCCVHLPAAPGIERRTPRTAARGAQGGQGERVLVVEDETALRQVAARILQTGGYTVTHTGSPTEALSLIEHDDAVDLLLTDVVMPEMLGTELAVRVAEIRPDLPILYMSGYIDPLVGARYQMSDPERIVQKPFSREDLLARVRDTLNRTTR